MFGLAPVPHTRPVTLNPNSGMRVMLPSTPDPSPKVAPEPPDPPDPPDPAISLLATAVSVSIYALSLVLQNHKLKDPFQGSTPYVLPLVSLDYTYTVLVRISTARCRLSSVIGHSSYDASQVRDFRVKWFLLYTFYQRKWKHCLVWIACLIDGNNCLNWISYLYFGQDLESWSMFSYQFENSSVSSCMVNLTKQYDNGSMLPYIEVLYTRLVHVLVLYMDFVGSILASSDDTSLAFVRSFTAVCRLCSILTMNIGSMNVGFSSFWQVEKKSLDSFIFTVKMVPLGVYSLVFSPVEFVYLLISLLGLSSIVAGSFRLKLTNALSSVPFKGSSSWCFVAFGLVAEISIKYALVAILISGISSLDVYFSSRSFISPGSNVDDEEIRGLPHKSNCSSVLFASIFIFHALFLAVLVVVVMAMLYSHLNNYSLDGD